jgi:Domain of unknown function (DUF4383)
LDQKQNDHSRVREKAWKRRGVTGVQGIPGSEEEDEVASVTRFYALLLSTILLLSGVPGIFPNIVSFQPLVTFFALTMVHGVVHVAVGILGLLITALASDESVRIYTLGIALLYGILAAVGLLGLNFGLVLYFNAADNWLHGSIFILSFGVFIVGIAEERLSRRKRGIIDSLPTGEWGAAPASFQGRLPLASRSRLSSPTADGLSDGGRDVWSNPALSERPQLPIQLPQSPQPTQRSLPSQPLQPSQQSAWAYDPPSRYPAPQLPHYPQRPEYSDFPDYPDVPGATDYPSFQENQPPQQPMQTRYPVSPQTPAPDPQWQNQRPASPLRDPWTREQRRSPYAPSTDDVGRPSPSQPSLGQAGQGSAPWSPWPQDSQPRGNSAGSQPREQWPMDEWPSIDDSRTTR